MCKMWSENSKKEKNPYFYTFFIKLGQIEPIPLA